MKPIVIFGTSKLASILHHYIETFQMGKVCGFTAESNFLRAGDTTFEQLPIVPFECLPEQYPPDTCEILVAVGYTNMNQERARIFQRCREKGYSLSSFVHPTAYIDKSVELGEGTIILEHSIISAFCRIGEGNLIWNGVMVSHHSNIGSYCNIAPRFCCAGNVRVGDYCFLGVNATVQNDVSIAKASLIGGGAYVSENTNPYDVIVPPKSLVLREKSTDFF